MKGLKYLRKVTIYTDGSCQGNPGPGAWAARIEYRDDVEYIRGTDKSTTNNRMELMGVISALEFLKEPCEVDLYSDSQYVVKAFTDNWIGNWQKNGWRTYSGGKVKNEDLWRRLLSAKSSHVVNFTWVKGHSNNVHNNRVDEYARFGTLDGVVR